MTQRPEEEEEEETVTRQGSSTWGAGWHAGHGDSDTYGGAYRGVRPAPHGGAATVKPDDTHGSIDLCWCGLPFDHDWKGKKGGAPHPKQMSEAFYEARRTDGERRRGENSEFWTGDEATYTARHKRVRRERGPANQQKCKFCGEQARDWAQVHGTDGLDIQNDYNPLCRACHIEYDNTMKTRAENHPELWPPRNPGATMNAHVDTANDEAPQPRIERRSLRGYHTDVADVILAAVNDYGARYREANNKIILFPTDGSEPYTINARSDERQVKPTRMWFIRHVVGVESDPKKVREAAAEAGVVDEKVIRDLAEAINSPEHVPDPEPEPESSVTEPGEWVPYRTPEGGKIADRIFETNGVQWRCKECLGTDHEYIRDNSRGIGGHIRMFHLEDNKSAKETLWSPEARAKALDSKQYRKLRDQVEAAIDLLSETIGYQTSDPQEVTALKEANVGLLDRITTLEAEKTDLEAKIERLKADAATRTAHLREALGL